MVIYGKIGNHDPSREVLPSFFIGSIFSRILQRIYKHVFIPFLFHYYNVITHLHISNKKLIFHN